MTTSRIIDVEQAHIVALRTDEVRIIADCGHWTTPSLFLIADDVRYADTPGMGVSGATGYGIDREGRTACFDCGDADEVARLQTANNVVAYLAGDCRTVATWTGRTLGRVTSYHAARNRRCYVQVTDVHGKAWHGTGPLESGTYVRLHRTASR